jgi:hypothetical protein
MMDDVSDEHEGSDYESASEVDFNIKGDTEKDVKPKKRVKSRKDSGIEVTKRQTPVKTVEEEMDEIVLSDTVMYGGSRQPSNIPAALQDTLPLMSSRAEGLPTSRAETTSTMAPARY